MQNLTLLSQFALYFFADAVLDRVLAAEALVDSMVKPTLGKGWAERLADDTKAYRDAVELVIRETTETTDVLQRIDQLSQNVSQWRELGLGIARSAPPARRKVLRQAVGWGLGGPRTVKEMKDMLLTIKSRVGVHAKELAALGMAPALIELPARVLAALEHSSSEVAREKAEDSLARADAKELFGRVSNALTTVWRAIDNLALQGLLLGERDDASDEERAENKANAEKLSALDVFLDKALGEARVQARKRAASEALPADLTVDGVPEEDEEYEVEEAVG